MMRIVLFYHSLVSDWNHGNAHFLRGVASELLARGHMVDVYEPHDGWSLTNLIGEQGHEAVRLFRTAFPLLQERFYDLERLDLDRILSCADLVLVHEWNDHELVKRIGDHHKRKNTYLLFFHDTHHRSVTDPTAMAAYDLSGYDGVLAYGKNIRDIYLKSGWTKNAWVWHEAADVRVFNPRTRSNLDGDLVWVGNWGDEERSEEIREFLVEPVRRLKLNATVYGVRYPRHAVRLLEDAGIRYGGWLPNFLVPKVFGSHRVTIHIPRRPYSEALSGIPTIRPFEALACGIPLVSAPWRDTDRLFKAGEDLLFAADGREMTHNLRQLLENTEMRSRFAARGRASIIEKHTCGHRVNQLLQICREIGLDAVDRGVRHIQGRGHRGYA